MHVGGCMGGAWARVCRSMDVRVWGWGGGVGGGFLRAGEAASRRGSSSTRVRAFVLRCMWPVVGSRVPEMRPSSVDLPAQREGERGGGAGEVEGWGGAGGSAAPPPRATATAQPKRPRAIAPPPPPPHTHTTHTRYWCAYRCRWDPQLQTDWSGRGCAPGRGGRACVGGARVGMGEGWRRARQVHRRRRSHPKLRLWNSVGPPG